MGKVFTTASSARFATPAINKTNELHCVIIKNAGRIR
jgi:hypothetical protein